MLFIANWKMHGNRQFVADWCKQFTPPASQVAQVAQVVVCPPFPYLSVLGKSLPPAVSLGAQDVAAVATEGARTGEVSAQMLRDIGCTYALVGHSERRARGETDDDCKNKIQAALAADIVPVLCIGETAAQHRQTEQILTQQMQPLADALSAHCAKNPTARQDAVLAYEPVWAIGSGKTPTANKLAAVQQTIRQVLNEKLNAQIGAFGGKISVLYGGSVGVDNANLPRDAGMDGGLVGGASLDAALFSQLCRVGAS